MKNAAVLTISCATMVIAEAAIAHAQQPRRFHA